MNTKNRARIQTASATLEFGLDKKTNKIVLISKDKDIYVVKEIFDAARRKAAAILRKKAKKQLEIQLPLL